jgi:ResB-like family
VTTRSVVHPGRVFHLLASLRVGVVTMVALAVVCGVATFYESRHGTAAAQRAFYQTAWFTGLLSLLAVNILFSMLRRYPWTRHQAGFVMAHVGIVLLLVGSLVSLHLGLDGTVALYEGEGTGAVTVRERVLAVEVAGRRETFAASFDARPPRPDRPAVFAVPGTPVTLVAEDYARHAEVSEIVEPAEAGAPALTFSLDGTFGHQSGWLLAGGDRAHVAVGPLHLALQVATTEAEARAALASVEPGNHVAFVVGPGPALRYALSGSPAPEIGSVRTGQPIATPWMGLTATVDTLVPHAAARKSVRPAPPPAREERRTPAVRVRFDSPAGGTAAAWVPWGESVGADLAEGTALVSFGEREVRLPFRLTLLDFRADTYPGSRRPASYESRVRVEEADGTRSEHLISMNHPLHHRGYIFFQASFVEGQPMMSILSVSRSPGLPLVYLGTALVSLGLAWMFYVKPWLARRQARRRAPRPELTGSAVEVTS